jgi:hypothetical protein
VHKAQGITVDHAFVLASPSMDRHLTYVALSRHRKRVCLYWSRDEFADDERLRALLSRERHKESTLDYGDGAVVRDSSAAYAGRRGLIPESAILVPAVKPAAPLARPQPAPLALPKVSPAKSEPNALRRRPPPPNRCSRSFGWRRVSHESLGYRLINVSAPIRLHPRQVAY